MGNDIGDSEPQASGRNISVQKLASSFHAGVSNGKSCEFVAKENTQKVKVQFYWKIASSATKWLKTVFFLEQGKTIPIEIDGHSIITNEEPY